jgi:hypothetical protein
MKFYWKSAASGNFATAGNWSPSGPPSVFDQAMLTATGAFYTVTATSDQTVLTVNTSADATLDIQSSTFTAEAGTGAGANNGTIYVGQGSTFAVAGTLNNPGTIDLFGAGETAYLQLIGDTTLKGGELHLSGYTQIDGNGTLTNSSNSTIDGAGTIYVPLVNEKSGVIEANGGELDIYSNVTNAGVLDATGGTLFLLSNVITNTFLVSNVITDIGSLKADSGATISLQNTTIHGGTLTGDGLFTVVGTTILDGSAAPLNNQGDIGLVEAEGSIAELKGTINNTGTIEMGYFPGQGAYPGPNTTTLLIGATGTQKQVTLTGKGTVLMDYGYSDFIEGDADVAGGVPTTLNNLNNIIEGGGRIGDGGLTLKNSGTIASTDDDPLVIDTGARTVTNTGTMAAFSFSTLDIESPLNNAGGAQAPRLFFLATLR